MCVEYAPLNDIIEQRSRLVRPKAVEFDAIESNAGRAGKELECASFPRARIQSGAGFRKPQKPADTLGFVLNERVKSEFQARRKSGHYPSPS
jgi:hypothetical protein